MEHNCSLQVTPGDITVANWAEVFNLSNSSLLLMDSEDDSMTFTLKDYFKMALYTATIVAALVGNGALIFTVGTTRHLRTTINYYLINLAVADLLICVFCLWVHCVSTFTSQYILGGFFCKVEGFAKLTCLTSSVLTLSAISCDRFFAIMFPLHMHVRVTKRRTNLIILVIWTISVLVSIPLIIYTKLYTVKVGIMLTAYSLIVWRLWIAKMPGEVSEANLSVQNRSKKKVIQMVCTVLLAFIICWMPLQMIVLYSQFGHTSKRDKEMPAWFTEASSVATYFAYANSALNPLIYGGYNNHFRRSICRCCPGSSSPTAGNTRKC